MKIKNACRPDDGKEKKERTFLLFSFSIVPSATPPTPRFLVYLQRTPLVIGVAIKKFDYSQILALLPNIHTWFTISLRNFDAP